MKPDLTKAQSRRLKQTANVEGPCQDSAECMLFFHLTTRLLMRSDSEWWAIRPAWVACGIQLNVLIALWSKRWAGQSSSPSLISYSIAVWRRVRAWGGNCHSERGNGLLQNVTTKLDVHNCNTLWGNVSKFCRDAENWDAWVHVVLLNT